MDHPTPQSSAIWDLAERQHGVVARTQLLEAGFRPHAITHRVSRGRLHPVYRSVYAVGRPRLTQHGLWLAAVLSCGPGAALSHEAAGALWGICAVQPGAIDVSVPAEVDRRPPGIRVHRRTNLNRGDVRRRSGIPLTSLVLTLVDLALRLEPESLEAAINEADKRDLTDPEALRAALEQMRPRPGIARLRTLLDRRTFTLTDTHLERLFLPLARKAGLPPPMTQRRVNRLRVDFYWPDLGLVVETDGLRYHRTPAQQAKDRVRDQAHAAAGLTPLRFTRAQVRFEPDHVEAVLTAVAWRLGSDRGEGQARQATVDRWPS